MLKQSFVISSFILLSYFYGCSGGGNNESKGKSGRAINAVDSVMNLLVQENKFSGNLLIADHGKIVFEKSYGFADFEKRKAMTVEKVFQIASISKQFTAMGIMILKEQGKLKYDDKVTVYLKNFPYKEITIRQLMNHTSGMPDFFDGVLPFFDTTKQIGNKDLYNIFINNDLPLNFPAGEKWAYCSISYEVLADILEIVSGRSYNDFLNNHVFEPLAMKNTSSGISYIPLAKIENAVQGYIYLPDSNKVIVAHDLPQFPYVFYLSKMEGDGSLYSTVYDLLKWDQALYANKIVKKETLEEAFTPSLYSSGDTVITDWSSMYGFGWDIIYDKNYGKMVNHGGGQVGYRSKIIRYLDQKVTVIFLSNMDNDDFWTYTGDIAKMYLNLYE